jgi:hypothetical protein
MKRWNPHPRRPRSTHRDRASGGHMAGMAAKGNEPTIHGRRRIKACQGRPDVRPRADLPTLPHGTAGRVAGAAHTAQISSRYLIFSLLLPYHQAPRRRRRSALPPRAAIRPPRPASVPPSAPQASICCPRADPLCVPWLQLPWELPATHLQTSPWFCRRSSPSPCSASPSPPASASLGCHLLLLCIIRAARDRERARLPPLRAGKPLLRSSSQPLSPQRSPSYTDRHHVRATEAQF